MSAQQIYRYKFSDEFNNEIISFSKLHQHDDRETYKENWNIWLETNRNLVEYETVRLTDMGYKGNVNDKMYKSGRYYFRTKQKKDPVQRKKYVSIDREIIELMDDFIQSNKEKPSESFDMFMEAHDSSIQEEIVRLTEIMDKNEIKAKFKKTFKNRYFLMQKKV
jgi:hypothetical protein